MATGKPDLTRIWAASAPASNVVDPDTTTSGKFSAGWLAEGPKFQHRNFIEKQVTQGLAYLNEQGVGFWDDNTVYPEKGMVKGSDGSLYKCVIENDNVDPVGNVDGTWVKINPHLQLDDMSFFNLIDEDAFANGDVVDLLAWHPGSSIGGGLYIYDEDRNKSEHDGGSVISPTVPWTTNTANFINGAGETEPAGTGVFVRINKEFRVDIAIYGIKYDYDPVGNTGSDNQVMFQAALNSGLRLKKSGTFLTGPVVTIAPSNTDIEGDGVATIYQEERISHYGNNHRLFKWRSIRRTGAATSVSGTRWWADEFDVAASNWHSEHCYWEGYFYAEDIRGHLTDPLKRLNNVVRLYNEGRAATGQNAGVFQQSRVDNFLCVKLKSYGGAGATGLNFVGENKNGMLIDLWEDGTNTYGGCEIENCPESNIKILGGTFLSSLWLDDTSDIEVIGADINWLRMTAQTEVTRNINIQNCNIQSILCAQFGGSPTESLDEVSIRDCILRTPVSNPQTRAIWLAAVQKITLKNITVYPDNYTEDLRFNSGFPGFDLEMSGLRSDNRVFVDGSGGNVILYDNGALQLSDTHVSNPSFQRELYQNEGVVGGVFGFASQTSRKTLSSSQTADISIPMLDTPAGSTRSFILLINSRHNNGNVACQQINGISNGGSVTVSAPVGVVGTPSYTVNSATNSSNLLSLNITNSLATELRLTLGLSTTLTQGEYL